MTALLRFLPLLALLLIGGGLWLLVSIGAGLCAIGALLWLDSLIDALVTHLRKDPKQ